VRPARELPGDRLELGLATRQIADELVALGAEPARDERRLDRRRPGEHGDRHAGFHRRLDEAGARVADARKPRVGDERYPLPPRSSRTRISPTRAASLWRW